MKLDLCSCSISTIDEIIQLGICVVVYDPITITTLDLVLCCEVSWSFISWFFLAYGSKEVLFCRHFIIIKALIWDESTHWEVDSSIKIVVPTITLKHNDNYVRVGVNTCGHFLCVWIIIFLQSLSSICSVPKSQFSNSFKDIDDLSWEKGNIISMKSAFVWAICWQRLHL